MKNHYKTVLPKEHHKRSLTNSRYYAIVNRKHKMVYHRDGHVLVFKRYRAARKWMEKENVPEEWRIMKVETIITTT